MREVTANSVLVVDDDPSIRGMLALRLARAGFEVRVAKDGIDAVVKLREHLPNVIISDLDMPRMSGSEFISVLRWRFPSIPVIVLSGSSRGQFRPGSRLTAGSIRILDTSPNSCKPPTNWFAKHRNPRTASK